MATNETILVLDFGSQYSQLIARRIRECKVYSRIIPYNTPVEEIRAEAPMGIILSGGPASVYQANAPTDGSDVYDGNGTNAPETEAIPAAAESTAEEDASNEDAAEDEPAEDEE